jgi:TolB protein
MKTSKLSFILACTVAAFCLAMAAAQEITIEKETWQPGTKAPIPIAISGFSGEVDATLRFDLEVAGFKFVGSDTAVYTLAGSNSGNVQGALALAKTPVFSKAYTGGTLRRQAHALADDVVQAVTGKRGIAQTRIAFKVDTGASSEIYVSDYDGHGAQAVTTDKTIVAAPCWAPGQGALYYTSYKLGNPDIFRHDLGTGQRKAVSQHSGLNTSAAVSPDGRRFAMILSKDGAPDVYVCDADGGNLKRLTSTREDDSSPCWSPDGQWICFATRSKDRRMLCKVPASGGPAERISTGGVSNPSEPDWSPDGKWIVFTAHMGNFEICVVPASGGQATVLVSGEDPSWAANSRTVVFARRRGGSRGLSLLDVPTKQVKDVPRISGSNSQPSWAR